MTAIAFVLSAALNIAFLVVLIIFWLRGLHDPVLLPPLPDMCPEAAMSSNPPALKPSPFQELSIKELRTVQAYLMSVKSFDLIQGQGLAEEIGMNTIETIELLPPPKTQVLAYLDGNGPMPTRFARCMLFLGQSKEVITVKVPAVKPTSHALLDLEMPPTKLWLQRSVNRAEYEAIDVMVSRTLNTLSKLIAESFGGYTYADDCGERCLTYTDTAPRAFTPGARETWFWFTRNLPGSYLHPVSLEILVQHNTTEVDDIYVKQIYYGRAVYDSAEELMAMYNNPNSGITRVRLDPADDPLSTEPLFSSLNVREPIRQGTDMPGTVQFEPMGRRFTVDGHHVSWLDWQLDVGIRVSAGIRLWDVSFGGERIAYEVSLQEAAAFYAGWTPSQAQTAYLDTHWGMGSAFHELSAGSDCPENAVYIDIPIFSGSAFENKRSVCVFEHHVSVPLRRHDDNVNNQYAGLMDHALVVRGISTVFNYDYIIDFVFHTNGVMEQHTYATGYVQACTFEHPDVDPLFGNRYSKEAGGTLHAHSLLWKVDLDIAGVNNSISMSKVKARNVYHPYLKRDMNQHYMETKIAETENDTAFLISPLTPMVTSFVNEGATNKWGGLRGYEIKIHSPVSLMIPETDPVMKIATWLKHHMRVTQRKDDEAVGSISFDQGSTVYVPVDIDRDYANGESVRNVDLVAWVGVGNWHWPVSEDAPTSTTPANRLAWVLKPSNFNNEDAAMNVANMRILTPDKDGNAIDRNPMYVDTASLPDGCTRFVKNHTNSRWLHNRSKQTFRAI